MEMRIHNEYLTLPTKPKREFHNITENVKLALEKNGIRDGMILVTTLHTNAAVFLNDGGAGPVARRRGMARPARAAPRRLQARREV